MKIIKKIAAIMLSVMMVLGMCSVVGAEGTTTSGTSATNDGKITIRNAVPEQTYTIYQILELRVLVIKQQQNQIQETMLIKQQASGRVLLSQIQERSI